jgi:Transposase, Mutator family
MQQCPRVCRGARHRDRRHHASTCPGRGLNGNTTTVTELLVGLRERGLDTTQPIFVGIDDAKALRAAVLRVFDRPVIGRCQLHKIRNVADKLPDHLTATVTKRVRTAYHADSALAAQVQLEALARELDCTHPGATALLHEGMAETLTVLELGVPMSAPVHRAGRKSRLVGRRLATTRCASSHRHDSTWQRWGSVTQQRQTDSPLTHNQRNTALQRRSAKSSLRVETSGTRSDDEAGCRLPQRRGRRSVRGRPSRLRCQQGSDDEGVACE